MSEGGREGGREGGKEEGRENNRDYKHQTIGKQSEEQGVTLSFQNLHNYILQLTVQDLTLEMRQWRSPHCCQLRKWSTDSCTPTPFTTHLLPPAKQQGDVASLLVVAISSATNCVLIRSGTICTCTCLHV